MGSIPTSASSLSLFYSYKNSNPVIVYSKRLLYNRIMMQQATMSAAMNCPACKSESKRFGKHRNGPQRFRCLACHKTFTESHKPAFRIEDYLNESRGIMAEQLLIEGCSVRTAERITGLHRDAILRLLIVAGKRCEALQASRIRNERATDIQADEIWSFIGKKEKNKTKEEEDNNSLGDCYTWVAIRAKYQSSPGVRSRAPNVRERDGVDAQGTPRYFRPYPLSVDH